MSTDLPTEEDVLTVLVLRKARPFITNSDDTEQWLNLLRWDQALDGFMNGASGILAQERLEVVRPNHPFDALEAAIADSERRLEAERAGQEVLFVLRHFEYPASQRIRLLDQEPTPDEVVRWASTILRDAEVSRHGG